MLGTAELEKNKELLDDLDRLVHKQQKLMKIALAQTEKKVIGKATTKEEVEARNIPLGSSVFVWKQDPSVERIGVRKVHLPHNILAGPKDDLVEVIVSMNETNKDQKTQELAVADENGDFLYDFDKKPLQFDMVNCYAIARMAVDMFCRDLQIDWKWQWDRNLAANAPKTPLYIICHAGEKPNAVYHRGKKVLKFYYYTNGKETTYLCRSLDIVAHETGHAILDALKPKLYSIHKGQEGALHESFGDLTSIFLVFDQLDLCEDVIAETKGDLRKARYVTAIGEQFSGAMNSENNTRGEKEGDDQEATEPMGMRNANNTLIGSEVGPTADAHKLSDVFSGYIFDVLVAIFNWERNPKVQADAETLHRVARIVRRMLLLALYNTGEAPDFVDLSVAMERAADVIAQEDPGDVEQYKSIIVQYRMERELAQAGKEQKPIDLGDF